MPISLVPRLNRPGMQNAASNAVLQRVQDFDWTSSPAGPIENWPEELRAISRTVLLSSTPMAVLIGSRGVVLANDAMRIVFGPDYDHGLGKPLADVLIHSAVFAQDMLQRALLGYSSHFSDMPLPISDGGSPRQGWFDLEFTPVVGAEGDVHGALVLCIDT